MTLTELSKDLNSNILDVLGPYIQVLTPLSDDDDKLLCYPVQFPC
jgi:hypothetical protein